MIKPRILSPRACPYRNRAAHRRLISSAKPLTQVPSTVRCPTGKLPTKNKEKGRERRETRHRVLSETARTSALAPFHIRNYRFQWPSDLLTSWAFEVETLVLGWYIMVQTGSVLLLTVFGP